MFDLALKTLFLPIETEAVELQPKARVLFMRARFGQSIQALKDLDVLCEQSFAPGRDDLQRAGFCVEAETAETGFEAVFVLPGRQRQEARAQIARAIAKTRPGGTILACAPNTEGAKTLETDLQSIVGTCDKLSKNKCRVVWGSVEPDQLDQSRLKEWLALDAPRDILDGSWVSRPGVFAWDRIDPASQLLTRYLPKTLAGRGADLGAGFGYLTRTVFENAPHVSAMDLYEAEKRALDLAENNLSAFKNKKMMQGIWSDVTKGIEGPYDFIVSNPPFHQTGKADRADVGQAFIHAASAGLRSGGQLFLVANRHLPYEQTLSSAFGTVTLLADEGGYKVIHAIKTKDKTQ